MGTPPTVKKTLKEIRKECPYGNSFIKEMLKHGRPAQLANPDGGRKQLAQPYIFPVADTFSAVSEWGITGILHWFLKVNPPWAEWTKECGKVKMYEKWNYMKMKIIV